MGILGDEKGSMSKTVLFLNPPGKALYLRDYYCSKVSKAHYLPQPVDLLMQTGWFHARGHQLVLVDAIVDKLSTVETLVQIVAAQPDMILTLCGSVSFFEDEPFLAEVHRRLPETLILASGDLFLEDPLRFLKRFDWLNGVITDFFSDGPERFLSGQFDGVTGLAYKHKCRFVKAENAKQEAVPLPRHDLFLGKPYRYAFATQYPMATVLTAYACPYPCSFCIMSTLGYSARPVEDLKAELWGLKEVGVRYIYFSDQTFFAQEKATNELLDFMIEEVPGFRWCCFSRVDRLDEARMLKMKAAGCNLVMFGVEWADDAYNAHYKKGYRVAGVRETFAAAQRVGLKTLGTFLLGVPGQDEKSIHETIDLALELGADYASFNVAVPRVRTSFREEALDRGLVSQNEIVMDQSGSRPGMGTGVLTPNQVLALKKLAYRRFYLRPSYLIRRLLGIRSFAELKTHFLEAFYILKGLVT